jgi:hypothetical protein
MVGKYNSSYTNEHKRKFTLPAFCGIMALFFTISVNCAWGTFLTYSDESTWQTVAAPTALEDFETYSAGVQISSLPALGIGFDVLDGGGYPVTYNYNNYTGHGTMQLANFPNGINDINKWDDISLYVLPGYEITALGFWNGDGQAATLTAYVYDASDNLIGSVGAYHYNFAGFTSDTPISYVVFDGNTGDGWNHLDGLQTNASFTGTVPAPATMLLFGVGLVSLAGATRRKLKK